MICFTRNPDANRVRKTSETRPIFRARLRGFARPIGIDRAICPGLLIEILLGCYLL